MPTSPTTQDALPFTDTHHDPDQTSIFDALPTDGPTDSPTGP